MKVLVLHRYFWPQPYPYAQMLKDIVEKIATQHSVSVLTTDSGELNEQDERNAWSKKSGISIQALALGSEKKAGLFKKAFNALYFGFWIFYKLLTTKSDVIMVATTPPVVIAMIVRWVSYIRKYKYIYHCQDIHPEAMLLGGNIQPGVKFNFLKAIDKKNINHAWKVITLSEDMKKTLIKRGCKTTHISLINNFIFGRSGTPSTPKTNQEKLHFLFAGSLGRLQNLTVLMESLVLLKHRKDVHFTFMGSGVMLDKMQHIKQVNKAENIEFLGQRSLDEAILAMKSADVGIISIDSKITSVAYPSKTMMYLGNGLPVFALVEKDTDIHEFINSNSIGKATPPTSVKNIADSINLFIDELKQSPIDRNHVKTIAENTFSKDFILPKFLEMYS